MKYWCKLYLVLHDDVMYVWTHLFIVSGESFHVLGKLQVVLLFGSIVCALKYAKTKLHERNAYEISYKLISFLFSLDRWFPTYGGGVESGKWRLKKLRSTAKMFVRLFCVQMTG